MIRVVGFDYGGVIAGYHSTDFNNHMAKLLGVNVKDYTDIYASYTTGRNKMVNGSVLDLIAEHYGKPEIAQAMKEYVTAKPKEPNPKIVEIFDCLQGQNITMGLLTNASMTRRQTLKKYNVEKYFEVIDISAETGLVKPAEEAYLHFFEQFGVEPQEMIYVDDVERNLEVPNKLGWHTVFYENPYSLKIRLHGFGL